MQRLVALHVCMCILRLSAYFSAIPCQAEYVYSRLELANIGLVYNMRVSGDYKKAHDIPLDIARPLDSRVDYMLAQQAMEMEEGAEAGILSRATG